MRFIILLKRMKIENKIESMTMIISNNSSQKITLNIKLIEYFYFCRNIIQYV